jgi:ABC-2 type transport system permease protein
VSRRPVRLRAHRPWARVIQSLAFVRKELAEIIRQPRLLALLVVGPFALLLLFGAGYRDDDLKMRTEFVGPAGSFYEDAVKEYQDVLARFVDPAGFTDDEAAARGDLERGDVDAVVIFPADPLQTVLSGNRAEVTVLHDKLDPIQQTAVEIASRLAVQEVNARVVGAVVGGGQTALQPLDQLLSSVTAAGSDVAAAVAAGDDAGAVDAARRVSESAAEARRMLQSTADVLRELGASEAPALRTVLDGLDQATRDADGIATAAGRDDVTSRASSLATTLATVSETAPQVAALDPEVLMRPFQATTQNIVPTDIEPVDFFTPSALALLLQHLALTFAALSLVRDRQLGLFELLRVGPLSSWEIVSGKTVAYLVVGMVVGVGLLEAAVHLLGVPLVGELWWVLVAFGLVLLASLAFGTLISLVSRSETQAVQWAMLTLLAGLFFSGFILSLDGLTYPVKAISWLLPVTYGIQVLQDVMLRGVAPDRNDLIGLGVLIAAYGGLSIVLLRRQLRRS